MSDARAVELIDLGNRLFRQREPMLWLWQELADQFYPERGNFTVTNNLGTDYAAHLSDSYPLILRRELGNLISAMLRPRDRDWFKATTMVDHIDAMEENARYLEYIGKRMKRLMYASTSKFVRATKEGDHDFITFGQPVLSVEEDPSRKFIFYRSHHLRNCAWMENEVGVIDTLHRDDTMSARVMQKRFGDDALPQKIKDDLKKAPNAEHKIRAVTMPSEDYERVCGQPDKRSKRLPFVTVYIDVENAKILREDANPVFQYVVPRWQTLGDSVYGFSPATSVALPDGRMTQALSSLIQESGEKAVDPAYLAREEVVREMNIQAGGVSWMDASYDARMGAAIEKIGDGGDLGVGMEMRRDLRETLARAFYIDKLSLPPSEARDMTAYEVSQRMQEFVRGALPLFEPMEVDYNAALLDTSYSVLANMGAFDVELMPDGLAEMDFGFKFESPLQAASSQIVIEQFRQTLGIVGEAMAAGVRSHPVKLEVGLRDALRAVGGPSSWRMTDDEIEAQKEQAADEEKMAALMTQIQAGAQTAQQVGDAATAVRSGFAPEVVPFNPAGRRTTKSRSAA